MARILLIDDHQIVRDVAARMLERGGHEVHIAAGGAEGLRLWQEHGADLLVTDFRMPEMNGVELIRKLREQAPTLPAIITSGDEAAWVLVQKEGAAMPNVQRLLKPYTRTQLLDAVAAALGTKSA